MVRASRLSLIIVVMAALAVSGCMRKRPPSVAAAPVRDLDYYAYNRRAPVAAVPLPAAVANAYATTDPSYRLDSGDRLRIVIYGQEGLTNSYNVDAGGSITMPLIGGVPARGLTPAELAEAVTSRLRGGYIRDPYVAAEIEAYRPFFILGEVAAPGQYPYVPNMTVEAAVAIAGGYTPRAQRGTMSLTRPGAGGPGRYNVPPRTPMYPGDTVIVGERWF